MVLKQIQRKIWHNSPKAKKVIQFYSILTQASKNGILYALLNRTVADKQLGLWKLEFAGKVFLQVKEIDISN